MGARNDATRAGRSWRSVYNFLESYQATCRHAVVSQNMEAIQPHNLHRRNRYH